jgi:FtsZ-binding cell division protein ZapB
MEEHVLELTTHNESLFKEKQQSKMKNFELERKNSQLDANMRHRESTKVEIK